MIENMNNDARNILVLYSWANKSVDGEKRVVKGRMENRVIVGFMA